MLKNSCILCASLLTMLSTALHAQAEAPEQTNDAWLPKELSALTADEERKNTAITANLNGVQLRNDEDKVLQLGFVNLRRVMISVPQLGHIRAQLDSEFAQQRAEIEQQASELKAIEAQLAGMPRGDAYSELEKQVIAKRRSYVRLDASMRDAYSVRRNEELATLQQMVVDEIVGLAKDKGYDVILNDTGVIFVSPEADLTVKVIERLQHLAGQINNEN